MLKRFGIDPKTLDVDMLRKEYNSLYSKKETLQKTYKSAEKEINPLNRKLDNLNQYLKIPADKIFYPDNQEQSPTLQKLITLLNDCTEKEAAALLPMVRYMLELLRKQDNAQQ